MYPAIFLDRDGVIIENRASYVRSWKDVLFYPQAIEAICKIRASPFKIFIVTNQSAVGRGIISLDEANLINSRVVNYIQQAGGRIDQVFICPHAPKDNCDCRKPRPGLILQAMQSYKIDIDNSIIVGDAITDIMAGQSAGLIRNVMVRTGRGLSQISSVDTELIKKIEVFDDLADVFDNLFYGESWWQE